MDRPEDVFRQEADDRALRVKDFLVSLCDAFGEEFIVIGGWAINAYGIQNYTRDGDAMISHEVRGVLRDSYMVNKNARMNKEEFVGPTGDDIALYVEQAHRLPVTFAEAQAYHRFRDGLYVPCPEHLLTLKLTAWRERVNSPKGKKDQKDIIGLIEYARAEFRNPELLVTRFTEHDWRDLEAICADNETTNPLRGGNQWEGRALREQLAGTVALLRAGGNPAVADAHKLLPGKEAGESASTSASL